MSDRLGRAIGRGNPIAEAIFDRRQRNRDQENADSLQALLERFREQELGVESDFLRQSSSGIKRTTEMLGSVESISPAEAAAFATKFAAPGSDQFKNFQDQLTDVRTTRFLRDHPEIAAAIGANSAFELRQIMAINKSLGARRKIKDITTKEGKISTVVDPITGTTIPIEGAEINPDEAGLGDIFLGGGGLEGTLGDLPIDIRAAARRAGTATADRAVEIRDRQRNTRELAGFGERLVEIIESSGGGVIRGNTGKFAASLRSFLIQVGGVARVNGIPGVDTIDDLIDQASDGSFSASAIGAAQTSPLHLMFATAFARATNPKAQGISRENFKRALEATKGVASADPEQAVASIIEIVQQLTNSANLGASDFGIEEIRAEDIAPGVFESRFRKVQQPQDVGIGVTGLEGKEQAGPRAFTLDELREAVRKAGATQQ